MADTAVQAYLEELVEAVGRANHDYFKRRGQSRIGWDELPAIYRHTAKASHLEILLDGPVAVIDQHLAAARAEAPTLRLRLELFIAELRECCGAHSATAAALQALLDDPTED